MTRSLTVFLLVASIALPSAALCRSLSDDVSEVVVTATRLETPADEVSGTILVVSSQEIALKQARTVADALRGLPGVDLVSQGGAGKTSSVLLRGGDARFTLVMIDGVKVNDPSNPERTFDLAHMSTGNIERIEVLFGPQSTLYGSEAIGGVINIITKKWDGQARREIEAEAGSFATRRGRAAVRGQRGSVTYSLSADLLDTGGISAASEADGNTEKDGYRNRTLAGSLGFDMAAGSSIRLDIRSVDAANELDYYGGPGGDDPNFNGDADHLLASGQLTVFPSDTWESSLRVSSSSHDRRDVNEPDPARPFTMEMTFEGRSEKVEFINNLYLNDQSTFTVGLDHEKETARSSFFSDEWGPYTSVLPRESARISGVFLQEQYRMDSGMTLTLGARRDDHSMFGDEVTYRGGISVPVSPSTRFRAVYGTGFRAPAIDQLFNPDYGNPDLEAERSRGWEAGMEAALGPHLDASLSWFLTRYDNLIDWLDADGDPSTWWDGSYQNISRARTEGVDVALDARFGVVQAGASGSFLRAEDDQGEKLLRRPASRWGARLGVTPAKGVQVDLNATRVAERKDWGDVTLDPYTLVNLTGSCRLSGTWELFGRVQNLTDEQYEEAGGYGTEGRAVYVGIRAEL